MSHDNCPTSGDSSRFAAQHDVARLEQGWRPLWKGVIAPTTAADCSRLTRPTPRLCKQVIRCWPVDRLAVAYDRGPHGRSARWLVESHARPQALGRSARTRSGHAVI